MRFHLGVNKLLDGLPEQFVFLSEILVCQLCVVVRVLGLDSSADTTLGDSIFHRLERRQRAMLDSIFALVVYEV